MKFMRKLLHWNDKEAEILRIKMRESVAEATQKAEDLTRTMVLQADEIKRAMERK